MLLLMRAMLRADAAAASDAAMPRAASMRDTLRARGARHADITILIDSALLLLLFVTRARAP